MCTFYFMRSEHVLIIEVLFRWTWPELRWGLMMMMMMMMMCESCCWLYFQVWSFLQFIHEGDEDAQKAACVSAECTVCVCVCDNSNHTCWSMHNSLMPIDPGFLQQWSFLQLPNKPLRCAPSVLSLQRNLIKKCDYRTYLRFFLFYLYVLFTFFFLKLIYFTPVTYEWGNIFIYFAQWGQFHTLSCVSSLRQRVAVSPFLSLCAYGRVRAAVEPRTFPRQVCFL